MTGPCEKLFILFCKIVYTVKFYGAWKLSRRLSREWLTLHWTFSSFSEEGKQNVKGIHLRIPQNARSMPIRHNWRVLSGIYLWLSLHRWNCKSLCGTTSVIWHYNSRWPRIKLLMIKKQVQQDNDGQGWPIVDKMCWVYLFQEHLPVSMSYCWQW